MREKLTVQEIDKELLACFHRENEYTFEKILWNQYTGYRIYRDCTKLGELWIEPVGEGSSCPRITAYSEAMHEAKFAKSPDGYYHLSQEQKDRHRRFKDVYKRIRGDINLRLGADFLWDEAWPQEEDTNNYSEDTEYILDEELRVTPENVLRITREHAAFEDCVVSTQNWEFLGRISVHNRLGISLDGSVDVFALTPNTSRVRVSATGKQDYWLFKSLAAHILAIVKGIKHEQTWWGAQPRLSFKPDVGETYRLYEVYYQSLAGKPSSNGQAEPSAALGKGQDKEERTEGKPIAVYLEWLRQNIVEYFGESDLRDLCFGMGIDYDDLPGQSKKDKVRELLSDCRRKGRIDELVEKLQVFRPKVFWEDMLQ